MEKLFERDRPLKSNIPQNHSTSDPAIRKKIIELQQHLEIIGRWNTRWLEMENGPLKDQLKKLMDTKSAVVRDLTAELKTAEDDCGEAWFLLIGDYGGKSFKLMLSDLASAATNSFQGGFVVGEFLAKDTYHNLRTVFEPYYVRLRITTIIWNNITPPWS